MNSDLASMPIQKGLEDGGLADTGFAFQADHSSLLAARTVESSFKAFEAALTLNEKRAFQPGGA
jgi:hypothetical protein